MSNKAFLDVTNGVTVADAITPGWGAAGKEMAVATTYTLSVIRTTTLGFLPLIALPAGAVLTQLDIVHPDLDTGSPALVVDVGISTDPDSIHDGSTAMQAAGTLALPAASLFTKYDEAVVIGLTVMTNAATGVASGTIKVLARFIYDPNGAV